MNDLTERLLGGVTASNGIDIAPETIIEAAERIQSLEAELHRVRGALARQCDSMAFVLRHAELGNWYVKFNTELAEDRQALSPGEP